MPTTWNPADKTGNTTLSNGNLTSAFSTTNDGVRSVYSDSAGKWYWEAIFTSGAGAGVGFANASAVLGTVWSTNGVNAVLYKNGSTYVNGVSQGVSITFLFRTFGIAIDFAAQRVWLKNVTDGGNWNNNVSADPATNVGGVNIAAIGSPLFALLAGGSNNWTANFGATAFAGTVPSGFTVGFGPAAASAAMARAMILA